MTVRRAKKLACTPGWEVEMNNDGEGDPDRATDCGHVEKSRDSSLFADNVVENAFGLSRQ